MADKTNTGGGQEGQHLPDSPELALFVAGLFHQLGGRLMIDNGHRYAWRPEPAFFRLKDENLPQLPNAMPHEQFHTAEEWRGALKLAEYCLNRLSSTDKSFVFTLLAPACARDATEFDFRTHLQ